MISGWILALAILFILLLGGLYVIGMRIMTQNEIIIRAIPLGRPTVQERRPPSPSARGAHARGTEEIQ